MNENDRIKGMIMKKISIGCCCYNEMQNVRPMYEKLTEVMQSLKNYEYEIVFADNASTDGTREILREIANNDKEHVRVILNQANFGPGRSGVNCLMNLSGDGVILIPCDFQEPPEMILQFVKYWEEGYQIIWGQKEESEENGFKYALRSLYYKIIDMFSDRPQLPQVTGYGIMDKVVLEAIRPTKTQDPEVALRHLVLEYGFRIKLVPYKQMARKHGKSSYNVARYLSFAINSLCNTSTKPLRLMTVLGLATAVVSMIVAIIYFIYKLIHWDSFSVGIAPLVIGMFFFASVELFCIGILGEYIGVLLRKITNKTLVVEEERLNFDTGSKE